MIREYNNIFICGARYIDSDRYSLVVRPTVFYNVTADGLDRRAGYTIIYFLGFPSRVYVYGPQHAVARPTESKNKKFEI